MLHQSIKHELVSGLSYFLIGLISLEIVLTYMPGARAMEMIGRWSSIFIALSIARLIIIKAGKWTRRDQWQNVSKRRYW